MRVLFLTWILSLCAFGANTALSDDAKDPRVFVLVLANPESFDRSLPKLRFAEDDLSRMQEVLKRAASIPAGHIFVQRDGTRDAIRSAFASIAQKMRLSRPSADAKFLFYYTGHSDSRGLHLADGLLGKDELHALLATIPGSARIAFFDSCYSGALAAKGIKPSGDFVIPQAEYDEPSGSVFLSATSGFDIAFELEELRGSLFTHHLVNGLYGSADGNHDGLVTVDELYQYVYQQMSSHTMALPGKQTQKPEYSVKLQGKGALVLAHLQRSMVPVIIEADLAGRFTFSSEGSLQVFRLSKSEGQRTQILLAPGDYQVTVEEGDSIGRGLLSVKADKTIPLGRNILRFAKDPKLALVAKGERPRPRFLVALGVSNSTYAKTSPHVEGEILSPGRRVESFELRLLANAAWQQNALDYRHQKGYAQTLSLLGGVRSSFLPTWAFEGQEWRFMLGGGFDFVDQHWDVRPQEKRRTFRNPIPKVAYGIGTSFLQVSGLSWGISFRREFPFATDADSGDVLAFGANVFTAHVEL